MAFRIIKEGSSDYQEKIDKIKNDQLLLEMDRWAAITDSSETLDKKDFLKRYSEAQKRLSRTQIKDFEKNLHCLEDIKVQKTSLSSIQGNLDMRRLYELLSGSN